MSNYKSALAPIYQGKGPYSIGDLAAIMSVGTAEKAVNGREFRRVEFQYVKDLNASYVDPSKTFIKNVFGPLLDADGKQLQPADSLWDKKFPAYIYNAKGEQIAHPKAGKNMLSVGELAPIGQTQFDTTEFVINSKNTDGTVRSNKVKKLTVVCWSSEDPLAIANSRMNGWILDADGKRTDKRIGGHVTGITTGDGEFIAIDPPTRVLDNAIVVPTAESFKAAAEKKEVAGA